MSARRPEERDEMRQAHVNETRPNTKRAWSVKKQSAKKKQWERDGKPARGGTRRAEIASAPHAIAALSGT